VNLSKPIYTDEEELMQLALHAVDHGKREDAIEHLMSLIRMEPDNAMAHYFLAGLQAEKQDFQSALIETERAVSLDPELHIAVYQLGYLHLCFGRAEEAKSVWKSLDALNESDPLFLFKRGLLHWVDGDLEACVRDLESGMVINSNEPLNDQIRSILGNVEKAQDALLAPAVGQVPSRSALSHQGNH